jgi:hypothetical protein
MDRFDDPIETEEELRESYPHLYGMEEDPYEPPPYKLTAEQEKFRETQRAKLVEHRRVAGEVRATRSTPERSRAESGTIFPITSLTSTFKPFHFPFHSVSRGGTLARTKWDTFGCNSLNSNTYTVPKSSRCGTLAERITHDISKCIKTRKRADYKLLHIFTAPFRLTADFLHLTIREAEALEIHSRGTKWQFEQNYSPLLHWRSLSAHSVLSVRLRRPKGRQTALRPRSTTGKADLANAAAANTVDAAECVMAAADMECAAAWECSAASS